MINKLSKLSIVVIIITFSLSSCSVGPCDCASAEMHNDSKVKEKCADLKSEMTQSEELEFNKKVVECLEKINW